MSYILGLVVFAIILTISVAWHELGHFLPARAFGVKVSQFMVGFGPTLWSRRKGETEFGIKAFPLGGYIRMAAMYRPQADGVGVAADGAGLGVDGAGLAADGVGLGADGVGLGADGTGVGVDGALLDSRGLAGVGLGDATSAAASRGAASGAKAPGMWARLAQEAREVSAQELGDAPIERSFYRLSPLRRAVIMLGGPTMNLIMAAVLLSVAWCAIGYRDIDPAARIGALSPCLEYATGQVADCGPDSTPMPAMAAGIEPGDEVVEWNGQSVASWSELTEAIEASGAVSVPVVVLREDARLNLTITPEQVSSVAEDGTTIQRTLIGIVASTHTVRAPFSEVPGLLWSQISGSAKAIASLPAGLVQTLSSTVTGQARDTEGVMSVVGVARIAGEVTAVTSGADQWQARWSAWLSIGASLNIALWLFNLLPLLPLDGGHVVGAIWEGLKRTAARARRQRPLPGPIDAARAVPLGYAVFGLLLVVSVVLIIADVVNPIRLA